jgi:hypothetical protein
VGQVRSLPWSGQLAIKGNISLNRKGMPGALASTPVTKKVL